MRHPISMAVCLSVSPPHRPIPPGSQATDPTFTINGRRQDAAELAHASPTWRPVVGARPAHPPLERLPGHHLDRPNVQRKSTSVARAISGTEFWTSRSCRDAPSQATPICRIPSAGSIPSQIAFH